MSLRSEPEFFRTAKSFSRQWVTPITVSAILLALTTGCIWLIDAHLEHEHLVFLYFVPTTLIAIRYGSISAMCVTIATAFAAAYLLYAPRFSFMVESPLDLMELILFSMLALLASQVVSGFANDRDVERRRKRTPSASAQERWLAMTALWRHIRSRRG